MCGDCAKKEECQKPCDEVNKTLWADNRVMEKVSSKGDIITYPQGREVRFSEITEAQVEGFSGADVVPWAGSDFRLHKTTVFVERFFNKVPCRELAERFGVKENTIVCMYRDAVDSLFRMIKAMDARREGLKATKAGSFTDDEKLFLLVAVFGFNGAEVARMFGVDHRVVSQKVNRLVDRYRGAFSGKKADPPGEVHESMAGIDLLRRERD